MSATSSSSEQHTKNPTVQVTLAKFDLAGDDPVYRAVREGVPIGSFAPLVRSDYTPRGSTPLRDATAQFISHLDRLRSEQAVTIGLLMDESGSMGGNEEAVIAGVNEFVAGMADVDAVDTDAAGKVLAVIVTDGLENASRETSPQTLAKIVSRHEADGYTFIFLGANIDAWAQGESLGLSGSASGQLVNYASSPRGVASAMASVAEDSAAYLRDRQGYVRSRATSARRSVSEEGVETTDNAGAAKPPTPTSPYADAAEALRKAKKATR
jgi:hypothetical protein